jgi:hypothetical protein
MKVIVLAAIPCPPILDKIFLKIMMHISLLDRMLRRNEAGYPLFSPIHLHGLSHQIVVGVV